MIREDGGEVGLLLQNVEGFPAESSRRYAASLCNALNDVNNGWRFERPQVKRLGGLAAAAGEPNASRWLRLVRYPRLVRRWQKQIAPAVTHVLDHSHANLLRACDFSRSVVTLHDVIPLLAARGELDFDRGWMVRHTFQRKLRLIERCARVIVPSEATKRQLLRFANLTADRVVVVPHGVDRRPDGLWEHGPEGERERLLASHGIDPARRIVLHVCTANRYKNSPALLRMLARLPQEVVLLRVGEPLFDDEVELARRLGVADRIVNAGRVPGDKGLAAHYRAADVFAFPSTFEGFGWPPLEAMACGTPVVTSNAASLPEVVGDAGLSVDPHDDTALSEAVLRLLSDPEEASRRRAASLEWAAGFTWAAAASRTLEVYRQVADEADAAKGRRVRKAEA